VSADRGNRKRRLRELGEQQVGERRILSAREVAGEAGSELGLIRSPQERQGGRVSGGEERREERVAL
jgi:hypothetical protein